MLQVQFEQFGDAVLLHGDTIQHVGGLHGAPAVSDDDELRLIAHPAQVLGKPAHVGVIQRGLDLVQNAERSRVDGQNRKVAADGHQRLLAARESFQVLDDLARRCHPDANAAGEDIALVFQDQAGLTAAEQLGKDTAKVFVDGTEAVREDFPHS